VAVVDTDKIAHKLVEPGQPALAEVRDAFGPVIVDAGGRLRRDELARLVFGDDTNRKILEGILHPRIKAVWKEQVKTWREAGLARAVVVIPLLYETADEAEFGAVICVACSAGTQRERLRARGWDALQIENRIKAQWPAERKMDRANYVVWTEGTVAAHAGQLERIIPS
jgi:dephospho-CoA kinase